MAHESWDRVSFIHEGAHERFTLHVALNLEDNTLPISVTSSSMVLCALVAKIRLGKRRIVLSLSQN